VSVLIRVKTVKPKQNGGQKKGCTLLFACYIGYDVITFNFSITHAVICRCLFHSVTVLWMFQVPQFRERSVAASKASFFVAVPVMVVAEGRLRKVRDTLCELRSSLRKRDSICSGLRPALLSVGTAQFTQFMSGMTSHMVNCAVYLCVYGAL
jgi:hypothetical protein